MNLLYCGDGNIEDGVIISVLSFCKNVNEPLNVYLVTASVTNGKTVRHSLSPDFALLLEEKIKEYNENNKVTLIDISDEFNENKPYANMDTRFTPCCMLRLYTDMLDEIPERVLYIDNDVICRKNPSDFYYQKMDNFELAGVLDYYGSWFFKHRLFKRDYINSGVLLLNMKKIRQTGLFEKSRKRCAEIEMFMPDQSALNKLSAYKKICPRKYNEQRKLHKDTVFQHFTTSFRFFPWFHTVTVKPWNITGMHETLKLFCYDNILNEYLSVKEKYNHERAI